MNHDRIYTQIGQDEMREQLGKAIEHFKGLGKVEGYKEGKHIGFNVFVAFTKDQFGFHIWKRTRHWEVRRFSYGPFHSWVAEHVLNLVSMRLKAELGSDALSTKERWIGNPLNSFYFADILTRGLPPGIAKDLLQSVGRAFYRPFPKQLRCLFKKG